MHFSFNNHNPRSTHGIGSWSRNSYLQNCRSSSCRICLSKPSCRHRICCGPKHIPTTIVHRCRHIQSISDDIISAVDVCSVKYDKRFLSRRLSVGAADFLLFVVSIEDKGPPRIGRIGHQISILVKCVALVALEPVSVRVVNCCLRTINCCLRVVNCCLRVVNCCLRVINCCLRVVNCCIRVVNCCLRVVTCCIRVVTCCLRLINNRRRGEDRR